VYLSSLFVAYDRFFIVHRQSPLGPVDPSFRALSGRVEFLVRRHKFNKDNLSFGSGWSTDLKDLSTGNWYGIPLWRKFKVVRTFQKSTIFVDVGLCWEHSKPQGRKG
jgi:hypothetical protein